MFPSEEPHLVRKMSALDKLPLLSLQTSFIESPLIKAAISASIQLVTITSLIKWLLLARLGLPLTKFNKPVGLLF